MQSVEREGTTEGPSRGADVVGLIESLCLTSKDGVLEVQSELGTGKVVIRSGRVAHAQVANLEGNAAFSKIAAVTGAECRLLPLETGETVTITKPWEDLLVDAAYDQERDREKGPEGEPQELNTEVLSQIVRRMNVAEKVRFALRCGKEGRTLLIRDSSRVVQLAVIGNPRITETEVSQMAGSKTVDEEILRRISEQREWLRYYPIRRALVCNPKTPIVTAAKLLLTLMPQDVAQIAKSKDVPSHVALAARRLITRKR